MAKGRCQSGGGYTMTEATMARQRGKLAKITLRAWNLYAILSI